VRPAGFHSPDHPHARTFAIIPARYASTRFPGKALAELAGMPLIEHVYRRTAACPGLTGVIVATDDARIADVVAGFGGDARLTRPDHATGTDRIAEVARDLDCDLIVNVQGDEPLIEGGMIGEALAPMATGGPAAPAMTTLRRRFDDPAEAVSPHVVKVVVDQQGYALYFSRAPIPHVRTAVVPAPPIYKHIGLYVYRRDFLLSLAALPPTPLERAEALEQLRALEHGIRIKAIESKYDSFGVDTPEDLEQVRRLLAAPAGSA
jgi:3-deoxy-manno-octulosonate cytidylyltransferase (CMP-KDO synthetase)